MVKLPATPSNPSNGEFWVFSVPLMRHMNLFEGSRCTIDKCTWRLFQYWLAVCWCKLLIQFKYAPEAPISSCLFVVVRKIHTWKSEFWSTLLPSFTEDHHFGKKGNHFLPTVTQVVRDVVKFNYLSFLTQFLCQTLDTLKKPDLIRHDEIILWIASAVLLQNLQIWKPSFDLRH